MTRFSAIGISVVAIFSSNLVGCGDGESGTYNTKELSVGGSSSTGTENRGGATTTESVGGATSSSSTGTAGQGNTSVGGATGSSSPSGGATGTNTAGGSSSGGSSNGGSSNGASSSTVTNVGGAGGSSSSVGGSTSQGGTAPSTAGQANGGQSQGGTSAVGGSSSGQGGGVLAGNAGRGASTSGGTTATSGTAAGTTGVGGESTGGAAGAATGGTSAAGTATGGAETGGTATGGAATGGAETGGTATGGVATGGAATGGDNTGGMGTGGTTFVPIPCTASFILPADGEILTEADDVSGKYCATGFFYDLVIATDAPNGSAATLSVNGSVQSPATPVTVQNAVVKFNTAQLGTTGTQSLSVQIGTGPTGCTATAAVTVNCLGHSTCNITTPTITATHVALNGVPTAQGGDRVSSEGSSYQAAFRITTDIQDGQPVTLNVTSGATTTPAYAVAMSGKADFAGVTLATDGSYTVSASCLARSGAVSTSVPLVAPVDTAGPDLAVTKIKASGSTALADGDHFDPGDLTSGALTICGTTAATDALDIDAGVFGATADNFCVQVGGNSPVCAPALSSTASGACVNLPCPGNGQFDLSVTLKDKAQNPNPSSPSPLKRTWTGLTCAATNPTVTFVDPVADVAFTDPSLRILANGNLSATRRDKNASVGGAQYDVVACTSAPAGSTAVLRVGRESEGLSQVAQVNVTAATGVCPVGSQGLITFPDVTLPESLVDGNFAISHPTQLEIKVTDLNFGQTTQTATVWVDSILPTLTLNSPAGFCGSYISSATAVTRSLVFGTPIASTTYPVTLIVTNPDNSKTNYLGTTLSFSQSTIAGVNFATGQSSLTASVTKPSGNVGALGGSCSVTVGSNPPPTVTWMTPTAAYDLGAVGNGQAGIIADANGSAAGWQGELRVCTSLTGGAAAGMTVTFSANGMPIGTPINIDQSNGCASLNPATVPEGPAVVLTATTSAGTAGSGTASITVTVDVTPPDAPTNLAAAVKIGYRRQATFHVTWTAGADGSGSAAGYDFRVLRGSTPIDATTFASTAEVLAYSGTPAAAGQPDGIDVKDRYIENDYQFAIRAYDSVGNRSAIVATVTPTRSSFLTQTITPPVAGQKQQFGWVVDGGSDLNGDGLSDLIVGQNSGYDAYVYFGSPSGFALTPSVTIRGTVAQFGYRTAGIGDVNKDGIEDLAVSAHRDGDGQVFVYYGRKTWPNRVLTTADADVTIGCDRNADANYTAATLGTSIARLGDINGDGTDDFAVGAPSYNSSVQQGQVAIILGRSGGLLSPISLPSAFGTKAIRITGDVAAPGAFGQDVVGLGRFYGTATNAVLVAAAPYVTVGANANAGRLYVFSAPTGAPPASIQLSSALATHDGVAASQALGLGGLAYVADLGPGGQPTLAIQNPTYLAPGRLELWSGSAAAGPFAVSQQMTTAETTSTNRFARVLVGGGVRGGGTAISLIGSSKSDFLVSSRPGTARRIWMIDGSKFSLANGLTNAETVGVSDVVLQLPADFNDFGRFNTPMRDLDSDGYADFAVGEATYTSTLVDGRVIVYR